MFGSKLRSWMEAVRPKKKQQRKEKKANSKLPQTKDPTISSLRSSQNDLLNCVKAKTTKVVPNHAQNVNQMPRYSGANLSSPESAYSTGYSTDGTSPGAPPEYYINIRTGTRYVPDPEKRPGLSNKHVSQPSPGLAENVSPPSSRNKTSHINSSPTLRERDRLSTVAVHHNGERTTVSMTQDYDACENKTSTRTSAALHNNATPTNAVPSRLTEVVVNTSITSPRQRNRIRTNPWVPGSNLSPGNSCTGLHSRSDQKQPLINSPGPMRYFGPPAPCSPLHRPTRCNSLSSSSCSSLSTTSLHWDPTVTCRTTRNVSGSEEDDCTLNEMMGKYDESYVYEKETDILSDSDPTDCEIDIDTGQDGGDEDDPLERDFDFIDNGSHAEFNPDGKDCKNTGHCTYHNFEMYRKASRRKTNRRSCKQDLIQTGVTNKHANERRKRPNSSKKRVKQEGSVKYLRTSYALDGSRSAGATPLSVRRTNIPVSKLTIGECLKKRSNSVSLTQSPVSTFDKRDKEADKKYKELIVEAEHILMSMNKSNGLSPRRIPGPPNKRVELLRTECSKPEVFVKNRVTEDVANNLLRIPSNNFSSPRFSPKRNHITNFINHNSPILCRRGSDAINPPINCSKSSNNTPLLPRNKLVPRRENQSRKSPKYKKKLTVKENDSSSSDSEESNSRNKNKNHAHGFCCPQSEPVKRKVYVNHKTVAFNLNYETSYNADTSLDNAENLRQQILANTIANLKRSLEDQSASLKQVYKGSQRL